MVVDAHRGGAHHDRGLVRAGRVEPAQRRPRERPPDHAIRRADRARRARAARSDPGGPGVARKPGHPGRRAASFSSEEQLLSMVDEATELDVLEEEDRELIHSIFEFNETVVREVMVPAPT